MVNRNSHCYHGLITIDSYAKTHTIIIMIIIIMIIIIIIIIIIKIMIVKKVRNVLWLKRF